MLEAGTCIEEVGQLLRRGLDLLGHVGGVEVEGRQIMLLLPARPRRSSFADFRDEAWEVGERSRAGCSSLEVDEGKRILVVGGVVDVEFDCVVVGAGG